MDVRDVDLALPDADEFQVAMTPDVRDRIWHSLHGDGATSAPERGVMCVLTRSPGSRRLSYLIREVVPPEPGEVDLSSGVEFSRAYRRRVKRRADDASGGVLYLHTHPYGEGRPSRHDIVGGRRVLHNDAQHLAHENPPLAIGILTPDENWMVLGCEYPQGTSVSEGKARYATAIRLVGKRFTKLRTYAGADDITGAAGSIGRVDPEKQDRQLRLWTREAQEMYAALRVGIVGLGGGGSILAEHVARAGVAELVLVDYDVIKKENLNRQQGASTVDASVWRPKVDVAARTARQAATNPDFTVEKVYGSVVEDDADFAAYRELLDCDMILHAADGHWTTWVLDEIAHAHLIPVISGGTRPEPTDSGVLKETSKGPITVSGPGHPCFRCARHYRPDRARNERHGGRKPGPDYNLEGAAADDRYDKTTGDRTTSESEGADNEPAPSVISLNGIVAGLMHLRLQDLSLGITGHVVGERRFLPAIWNFERGRDRCRKDCDRDDLIAQGEGNIPPLSKDRQFEQLRAEVSRRFTPFW